MLTHKYDLWYLRRNFEGLSLSEQVWLHEATAARVVRPGDLIHKPRRVLRVFQEFFDGLKDHRSVSRWHSKSTVSESVSICVAVLGTSRCPNTHILPIPFQLFDSWDYFLPIIFNDCPDSVVTVAQAVGRFCVCEAIGVDCIFDWICVIRGLDDHKRSFEVVGQVCSCIALPNIILVSGRAFSNGKSLLLVIDKFE